MASSTSVQDFAPPEPADALVAGVWNEYKNILRHLYLEEDRSVEDTMAKMKERHGFEDDIESFRRFFTLWGWDFKTIGPANQIALAKLRRERERQHPGKRTLYSVGNRYIDMTSLRRWLLRHGIGGTAFLDNVLTEQDLPGCDLSAPEVRCHTPPPNASQDFIVPAILAEGAWQTQLPWR